VFSDTRSEFSALFVEDESEASSSARHKRTPVNVHKKIIVKRPPVLEKTGDVTFEKEAAPVPDIIDQQADLR
jgi:hypothetical protein